MTLQTLFKSEKITEDPSILPIILLELLNLILLMYRNHISNIDITSANLMIRIINGVIKLRMVDVDMTTSKPEKDDYNEMLKGVTRMFTRETKDIDDILNDTTRLVHKRYSDHADISYILNCIDSIRSYSIELKSKFVQ